MRIGKPASQGKQLFRSIGVIRARLNARVIDERGQRFNRRSKPRAIWHMQYLSNDSTLVDSYRNSSSYIDILKEWLSHVEVEMLIGGSRCLEHSHARRDMSKARQVIFHVSFADIRLLTLDCCGECGDAAIGLIDKLRNKWAMKSRRSVIGIRHHHVALAIQIIYQPVGTICDHWSLVDRRGVL